jgi:TonB family protein
MIRARPGGFLVALAATLCCVHSAASPGQTPDAPPPADTGATAVAVDTYRGPERTRIPRLDYPEEEVRLLGEGWVTVSMMVDPQGKPFEVGVLRSTGNRRFEQAAVHAMEHATFKPATLNGNPIESVNETTVEFTIDMPASARGARPAFVAAYKSLNDACQAKDRVAADAAIQKLKVTNLYEDAVYAWAQLLYARLWGDARQQETAAWRALGGERFLSAAQRRLLLLTNFNLQVDKRDYDQALRMWDRLQKVGVDEATGARILPIIEKLKALRTSPASYSMSGVIDENGRWTVNLFKTRFEAAVSSGVIDHVKLKCSKRFVSFAFDPAVRYEVQGGYGDCMLFLEGTPGTKFQLTQS